MTNPTGMGVDASGGPVIDPTANVLNLVEAAIKRQDDLREAESRHVREIAKIRAEYQESMRQLETDRINAIRAVDAQAVAQGRSEVETRARALETTVAASAEAMRSQVAAAAAAAATSLANALDPVQKDIADLRRAQYEAQGQKTQVVEARAGINSIQGFIAVGVSVLVAISLYLGIHNNSTPARTCFNSQNVQIACP